MLNVLTLDEADALLSAAFSTVCPGERVPLAAALSRVLSEDVCASADLPPFTRSSVDGYAVRAADTFGCSESMPALLQLSGAVEMGCVPEVSVGLGTCVYVPTGGALPGGADAMVMLEYAERFGGEMAIHKPAAPGQHLVLRGDDRRAGQVAIARGTRLSPRHIGVLAALGCDAVNVKRKPVVRILSTGDEVVPVDAEPLAGQVRDVNGPMLAAQLGAFGAEAEHLGIVPDREAELCAALEAAAQNADLVLLSGGSSAGEKDGAARAFSALGTVLFHGLALKPGKPTLAGTIRGVPAIGLPGHPAAAYMAARLLVQPVITRMLGQAEERYNLECTLSANIPSNHGRQEAVFVRVEDGVARPLVSKSGLVATLSESDGYVLVPRDCEGLMRGARVNVTVWGNE